MSKEIAIISTAIDLPTIDPVINNLEKRGYSYWLYDSSKVLNGDIPTSFTNYRNSVNIKYGDRQFTTSEIKSAWYRHPNLISLELEDKTKEASIIDEISRLNDSIWSTVQDDSWLNSPLKMDMAMNKMLQLITAEEIGFSTPNTIIANNWDDINEIIPQEDQLLIKMSKGLLMSNSSTKVMYASIINPSKRKELEIFNPFPAIYQEYLSKKREWRITVVGDEIFPAAIYTDDGAKDDWRKHQFTKSVKFKSENLPDNEIDMCIRYLGKFGLTYGAFDLVEDDEGKITFLECNVNGQYQWLEEILKIPISECIANELIKKIEIR